MSKLGEQEAALLTQDPSISNALKNKSSGTLTYNEILQEYAKTDLPIESFVRTYFAPDVYFQLVQDLKKELTFTQSERTLRESFFSQPNVTAEK